MSEQQVLLQSAPVQTWVFKEFRLYCAHSVASFGPDHKCAKIHGHTYKVRVEVKCDNLNKGIGVPFDCIQNAWDKRCAFLDHTNLNDQFENPTTEVLAAFLKIEMQNELGAQVAAVVQETESSGVVIR